MHRSCRALLLVALALSVAPGCAVVDPGTPERDAWAVWSDDQTEILVVIWHWRTRHIYMDSYASEDYTTELRVYSPDGRYLRTLLPETEGAVNYPYFMRSAGYVLSTRDGWPQTISVEDGRRTLLPTERFAEWSASPDGSLLVRAVVIDDWCTWTLICRRVFTFADPSTLDVLAASEPIELDARIDLMWAPTGEVYVYSRHRDLPDGYRSVMVRPTGEVRAVEPLPCVVDPDRPPALPVTSSHWISHDGRLAIAEIDGRDRVTLRIEETDEARWPDTCFPAGAP